MANRRLAPAAEQPASFAFTPENAQWARGQVAKYPEGRQASAVIPLLWKAQEQNGGWLPRAAIEAVAGELGMPHIRVLEVATFYTMFALEPVGRYWIQVCGTVPCHSCGAQELKASLQERLGAPGHVSSDGNFSWLEVECLGACCNAPMVQINQDYYEDLTPESLNTLLDDLAAGRPVKVGSQIGRVSSEPTGAVRTLTDPTLFDGSRVGAWRKRFEQAENGTNGQDTERGRDEAASTEQRAKTETKPAQPDAGRAIESPAADTPAIRAAESEKPAKADDSAKSQETPPAALAEAALKDTLLRTEPPPHPAVPGADYAVPELDNPEERANAAGARPPKLDAAREDRPDDLTLVKGIDPISARRLNDLGIWHLDQIAAWKPEEITWIDACVGAPGRIGRENWVGQAADLAAKQG